MPEDTNLLTAIDMMNSGIKQYQTQQAVNDASRQLSDMNAQAMGERDRIAANAQIGQQLALRLTGVGSSPQQIGAATEGLMPSANNSLTQLTQSQMAQAGEQNKMAIAKLQSETELKKQQMMLDALQGKAGRKAFDDASSGFEKQGDVASLLKNLPTLQASADEINQNIGKNGASAVINLAQLGVIRSKAGRVNEQEIKNADVNQSYRKKLANQASLQWSDEYNSNTQKFWQDYTQQALKNSKDYLYTAASRYANAQSAKPGSLVSSSDLKNYLVTRHGLVNPDQGQIDLGKAWLSDPKNAQDPRAAAVAAKIKALENP